MELLKNYKVEVVEGIDSDGGKSFALTKERMIIGRDRNADINLTDPEISREHCLLLTRGNRFLIQQRSDTSPTFINEVELVPGAERNINENDVIKVSSRTILRLIKINQ